jgi:predicted site-specific integrase-resolvase
MKPRKMIIGYGRTSTFDQAAGLAAQERDLKAAGATKLFTEQVSSVAQRARLAECLAFLRDGDVLMVTKPDRLARSTAELLAIETDLSKRGVGLVVLSIGWRTAGHPQPPLEAHADDLGRRGDLGAGNHARAPAQKYCQGQGQG